MEEQILQRVELLVQQSRNAEAKEMLAPLLQRNPDNFWGLYYMTAILLQEGNKKESRELAEKLLQLEPDAAPAWSMSINVDLADEKYEAAEKKAAMLIEMAPRYTEGWVYMARAKLGQRNYDRALEAANKALEIDPENEAALNLKILIGGFLGEAGTHEAITDALNLNPESPSAIANHGYQLVREGKIKEALERLKLALSLDPTNDLARYAMSEALKSRFLPYRLFFKYKEAVSKLSGGNSWAMIIGIYIGFRIIRSIANSNPDLQPILNPIIYLLVALFLLSWVIDPLMNVYLMTNKYGRLLLDKDDKIMAQLTGGSLLIGAVSLSLHFFMGQPELFLYLGVLCIAFMIPLGTFMQATKPSNRNTLKIFTIGIVVSGLLGAIFGIMPLVLLSGIGLFIYQWVWNGMMIKEGSRVVD